MQSDAPVEQMLETTGAVLGAGWQSGKFLYVDTDLKIDLPEARVVLDRERLADLGLDLAGVGRELGTLLGGAYVNRFNFFDRSYKVIPQIGDEDRATVGPLLDLKIKTPGGQLVPVSTFTHIETSTAPRTLNRFQQRNAVRVFGGVKPGVTKEEGLRVLEDAAAAARGPRVVLDYAGESRQIRHEGSALTVTLGFAVVLIYLVLAAQFQSFRDPLIVLLGSVPLAISGALVFSFLDLTTINIYSQVGLITLVGLIAKNGILIVEFANQLQGRGLSKAAALREASLDATATGADDLGGHRLRASAPGLGVRTGSRRPQQHWDGAGLRHDRRDTVHPVHRAGVLLADRGGAPVESVTRGTRGAGSVESKEQWVGSWESSQRFRFIPCLMSCVGRPASAVGGGVMIFMITVLAGVVAFAGALPGLVPEILAQVSPVPSQEITGFSKGTWELHMSTGYTHTFQRTEANVTKLKGIPIILGGGVVVTDPIGASWYRGQITVGGEVQFNQYVEPLSAYLMALTPTAKYTFLASDRLRPYVEIGAGIVWTDLADRIPEKGSQFNFNLQAGAGLSYFVLPTASIDVTYRFQHISNAGTAQPNKGIDAGLVLVGISKFF